MPIQSVHVLLRNAPKRYSLSTMNINAIITYTVVQAAWRVHDNSAQSESFPWCRTVSHFIALFAKLALWLEFQIRKRENFTPTRTFQLCGCHVADRPHRIQPARPANLSAWRRRSNSSNLTLSIARYGQRSPRNCYSRDMTASADGPVAEVVRRRAGPSPTDSPCRPAAGANWLR